MHCIERDLHWHKAATRPRPHLTSNLVVGVDLGEELHHNVCTIDVVLVGTEDPGEHAEEEDSA